MNTSTGPPPSAGSDALLPPGRSTRSIVFTDIVGSTAMRDDHGDVKADAARRDHDVTITGVVDSHGGVVVKGTGDGLLAVFSAAGDALEATAAMQRALARRNRSAELAFSIRVGAATGDIVSEDGDVFGTAVVEAARLCDLADGGQILATDLTAQLAQSGADVTLGRSDSRELKGLSQPVVVHEIVWETRSASPVPLPTALTARREEATFVGRADDLSALRNRWALINEGTAHLELIGGGPGLGKTRLVSELARLVHDDGGVVLLGQCAIDEGYPFRPFAEALQHYVNSVLAAGSTDVSASLGSLPGDLVRLVPELPAMIPRLPDPTHSVPATQEFRLFEAVVSWLGAVSRDRQVLLVVDDLQWASAGTASMLRHVLMSDDLSSVLVMATHRTEDIRAVSPVQSLLADLHRGGRSLNERTLDGIGQHAVEELIAERGVELTIDAAELARHIVAETDGNAFFVTELIDDLVARATDTPIDPTTLFESLPDRVVDVVGQRLATLSAKTREMLDAAAVCGRRFELSTLTAALGAAQPELLAMLEEAGDVDLIVDADGPRLAWTFRHALIRDAVRAELSAARRARLHATIASTLDATVGGGGHVDLDVLAFHSAEAAESGLEVGRAVAHCHDAARRATGQLAYGEALVWYERAIALMQTHEIDDNDLAFDLYLGHGIAQKRLDHPAAAENLRGRTVEAARESSNNTDLATAVLAATGVSFSVLMGVDDSLIGLIDEARAAIHDDGMEARLLALKALELTWSSDDRIRFDLSDQALDLARRSGEPAIVAAVLAQRQITTWSPASLGDRLTETDELLALARASDDPYDLAIALRLRIHPLIEATQVDEAAATMAEAMDLVSGLGQPELEGYLLHGTVQLTLVRGDLQGAATQTIVRLKEVTEEGDFGAMMLTGGTFVEIRRMQGRMSDVVQSLDMNVGTSIDDDNNEIYMAGRLRHQAGQVHQAFEIYEQIQAGGLSAIRTDTRTGPRWMDIGHLCARFGDKELAPSIIECLTPHAGTMFAPLVPYPVVDHMLGMLHASLDDHDEAMRRWATALNITKRMGASFLHDETVIEQARLRLTRSDPGDGDRAQADMGKVEARARERGHGFLEQAVVELRGDFGIRG